MFQDRLSISIRCIKPYTSSRNGFVVSEKVTNTRIVILAVATI